MGGKPALKTDMEVTSLVATSDLLSKSIPGS